MIFRAIFISLNNLITENQEENMSLTAKKSMQGIIKSL